MGITGVMDPSEFDEWRSDVVESYISNSGDIFRKVCKVKLKCKGYVLAPR